MERESPLRIDTCLQTSDRAPFQRPPYAINGTRNHHLRSSLVNKTRRVISRVKSNNSKNTVQTTTKSSRTLRQGSTSSLGVLRPFWTQSSLEMSKKLWFTYRDRLERFGIDLLERTFRKHGTTLDVVSNQRTDFQGTQQELAEKLLSVLTTSWPKTTEDEPLPMLEIDKKGVLKTPNMSST